jgi:hypothetical protein
LYAAPRIDALVSVASLVSRLATVAIAATALSLHGGSVAMGSQTPTGQPPSLHHPVSTSSLEAQAAFDQGLLAYYAYNVEAAEQQFSKAAQLDPHLAIAYWGIAMSNASNLNVDPTLDRERAAENAVQKARSLESYASDEERDYIEAAALRFSADPKADHSALLVKYRDAMQRVAANYPTDADASVLYGEAALYVAVDYPGQRDALTDQQRVALDARVAALLPYFEGLYARYPTNIGVLHFLIHTADDAQLQQRALQAARQLASFDFAPQESHLTHMPAHIFFKLGLYEEALAAAQRSVALDRADFACCNPMSYAATRFYHAHNVAFLLYALTELGDSQEALSTIEAEDYPPMLMRQLVADRQWARVLQMTYPRGSSSVFPFARGLAYAAQGDAAGATRALGEIPDAPSTSPARVAATQAMRQTLQARIAMLTNDDAGALTLLQQASAAASRVDALTEPEFPAMYYYSPHLALAQLACQLRDTATEKKAYQDELSASPLSPVALAGLARLSGQPSGGQRGATPAQCNG